ncbi:MAG: metallophosphoesterase [Clostridia bacterium]|nr:metallophosphoesterase [Clostridia bacterium]
MKILVISDTHGETDKAEEVVRKHNDIDLIIHLGDYFRDAQKIASEFPHIPVEYIYGNSDFMIGDVPSEKLLEYEGKRIFITHGHRYSVKWDYEKLHRKAIETEADILMFGHTHISELIRAENYLILNPGSISDSRGETGESYAIVEIKEGIMEAKIMHV